MMVAFATCSTIDWWELASAQVTDDNPSWTACQAAACRACFRNWCRKIWLLQCSPIAAFSKGQRSAWYNNGNGNGDGNGKSNGDGDGDGIFNGMVMVMVMVVVMDRNST